MKPSEHIKNIIEASRTIELGYIDEDYFVRQLITTDKLFISKAQHQKELDWRDKDLKSLRENNIGLANSLRDKEKELKELKEEVEEEFNKLIQMGDYVNGSDLEDSQKKLKEKGASK